MARAVVCENEVKQKMNYKRQFPAFYRIKKTQFGKRQNKTRRCYKHPGLSTVIFNSGSQSTERFK